MSRTVYALLVGIDAYPVPVRPLAGCVNDIERIDEYLAGWVQESGAAYRPVKLTNEQATRAALIGGFREHLTQAQAGDVALFYYSGHGSQEPAPDEFFAIERDRYNETLVCYDSRLPGQWDLADKELAQLIHEVGRNEPHLLVILDSCHSGSGTRDLSDAAGVRLASMDTRRRAASDYILTPEMVTAFASRESTPNGMPKSGWSLPRGRHLLLAACNADEEAKEQPFAGTSHGVFSYYLLETLKEWNSTATYRDLFKRVNMRVRNTVNRQAPQVEATQPGDLDQLFLDGAVQPRARAFTVAYDADARTWCVDGGAIHGLPAVRGEATTTLALFSPAAAAETLGDLTAALGEARVTKVLAEKSHVAITLEANATPDRTMTFKAVVTGWPVEPLLVALEATTETDQTGIDLVRTALQTSGPAGGPSLYLQESTGEQALVRVLAYENRYRILRYTSAYALAVDLDGYTATTARQVIGRLEHIERWDKIVNLRNPTTKLPANAVEIELIRIAGDGSEQAVTDLTDVRFSYEPVNERWQPAHFKLKLVNRTKKTLHCALLDVTERYAVWSGLIADSEGCAELKPGDEPLWILDGEPLAAELPDELWEAGVVELKERFKLIISEEHFDATGLDQERLDVGAILRGSTRGGESTNTFNRLLQRVGTREVRVAADKISDWTTSEFVFTIVRPQAAQPIRADQAAPLGYGVEIQPHPALVANAHLTSTGEASRAAGSLALPPILRNNPATLPLTFSASRGDEAGLSVIELSAVQNHSAVTPQQPLVIKTPLHLAEGEYALPVAYDGELVLPLGVGTARDQGVIKLDRLPEPTTEGRRGFGGTIKIFFQKVISEKVPFVGKMLGIEYNYPLLRVVDRVADDGEVIYSDEGNLEYVQSKVAQAARILLVVHGINSNTRFLAASTVPGYLKLLPAPASLATRYDLILACDYESLNTPIETTARALKARLAEVGLDATHQKTLHILAHSMGGLVSRWLIEHEGGNAIVDKLVLVGTPNAGSPWPTVEDWALALVGIGLNSLSAIGWPGTVLGGLVNGLEKVDNALDQMQYGSDFLKKLAAGPDNPNYQGIPYVIVAGNTSILPEFLPKSAEDETRLTRLLDKLNLRRAFYGSVTYFAFFNQPNDIAVAVESIHHVPERCAASITRPDPVGCDHNSYFITRGGLKELAEALPASQG